MSRLLLVSLVVVSGCGRALSTDVNPPSPDAHLPAPDANRGLFINVSLGFALTQSPITAGEAPESGWNAIVVVTRDTASGAHVPATLTVNDVEIPQQSALGVFVGYDFSHVSIPTAVPGSTVHFHAVFETASADVTFTCPQEVTITSPVNQSRAAAGEAFAMSWSRPVEALGLVTPDVLVRGFDPVTGKRTTLDFQDRIISGKTNDSFTMPPPKGAPQWLVELFAPGALVDNAAGAGECTLERRVVVAVMP